MKTNSGIHIGRQACCLLLIGAVALACASCSRAPDLGPTGTVSGTLSYKGQPLAPGTAVVFMNMTAGHTCMGETDAQGKYILDSWNDGDLPIGTYDVMIRPPAPEMDSDLANSEADVSETASTGQVEFDFPEKYGALATSGLKFEVKEGTNDIPIELVD